MGIVVQKYGGSSVADVDRLGRVADRIAKARQAGQDLVVVVSAMGDTTDELLALARGITKEPSRRELDMLLSAGERISMALLSMALQARGVPAVSFTGSQSGIITSDAHTNARIVEVRPFRVQDELARGKVVIVAGYQGVSYRREVTTLGRGGSDTTAVALAAALGAEACEIYSDVEGVFSADPRVVPAARRISEISYEEMQELAQAGAKVLNAQAVEFAKERGIALYARSSFGGPGETVVRRFPPRAPGRVVGVASEAALALLAAVPGTDGRPGLADLLRRLDDLGLCGKQLHCEDHQGSSLASVVLSLENLHDFPARRGELQKAGFTLREGIGAVSAIGTGINASFKNVRTTLATLAEIGAPVLGLSTSSFRISVLLEERLLPDAARRLHEALVEADPVL
jgi:aspartate kinase